MHPIVDKLTWFQMRLDEELKRCGVEYIDGLVEEYLARFDDEMTRMKASVRPDRPVPIKLDQLEALKNQERKEYEESGMEIPDLTLAPNVAALRAWDGTYHSIKVIKMVRFRKPQQ
jgi:translation machinery-associated protein 16